MDQSTLFISSITLMVVFSAVLAALRKVIGYIEKHQGNFDGLRRTDRYERYSHELCGCLAMASFVEIVLLGISMPALDDRVLRMCDPGDRADCDEVAIIWQTITFAYCGATVLLVCILVACLVPVLQRALARPRRLCYDPLILTFAHLMLQLCALLILTVFCSDFVFQHVAWPSRRDACIVIAACGILILEIDVAVWLYGTVTLCVETLVLTSRGAARIPHAPPVQEVVIDLDDSDIGSDDDLRFP